MSLKLENYIGISMVSSNKKNLGRFEKSDEADGIDDVRLWNELKQGNIEAFEKLYKKYYKPLFLYGYKLSTHREIAEDCVHELFFKIWNRRDKLSTVHSVKPYLYKAYRSVVLDYIEYNSKRIETRNLPPGYDVEFSHEEFLINQDKTEEGSKKLNDVLNSLTKRQKEIIYLRFYKDLSYDEIADVIQIKNQTVRNCISEAFKDIRKKLASLF